MSKLSTRTPPRSGRPPLEARILAVLGIVLATTIAAGLTGLISTGENDVWYQELNKAPGTPPAFVLTVVWPMLYSLMTVGAIIVWNEAGSWRSADGAIGVYFVQLAANVGWSALFFLLHEPVAALISLGVLWALIAVMMLEFRRHSLVAALLQTPYLLWVSYAAYLNLWVVLAN